MLLDNKSSGQLGSHLTANIPGTGCLNQSENGKQRASPNLHKKLMKINASRKQTPKTLKDLEKEGFEPEKVTQTRWSQNQATATISSNAPPHHRKTLNIRSLTLAHLANITVDGYNGRGVTQCFSCNNFHHNADNCYLKPPLS
ncbi:hypothetical protein TNCV_4164661 [Trichonephila clavipes]|nr:hypothetical protein TNCV_4164661 [Trichonephila clavipes]